MKADRRVVLTLPQAAALLGDKTPGAGRRLRWKLHVKERDMGRKIMIRQGGRGKGARYSVRIATLVRWCPDLIPTADIETLPRLLAETIERLESLIGSNAFRTTGLISEFRRVHKALRGAGIVVPGYGEAIERR